jgi:hypothetical protein
MLVFHAALYFGVQLQESLLCPNQMRAAGITIDDAPIQFDASSSHSIKVNGTLEIPLEMHGVISHLRTRLPTDEELALYRDGQFQSVQLTDDTTWEPYSKEFAQREDVARMSRSTSAIQAIRNDNTLLASPRLKPFPRHAPEEEEEQEAITDDEAEEEYEGQDVSDDDTPLLIPRRPWDPIKEARCIAVASRWARSREAIELADEDTLATRLIAAMNVASTDVCGDGLDERQVDSLITASEEDRVIAAMSTLERGPIITKEILAKRWGIGLDTAHRTLTATTQQGIRRVLHPVERRYKTRQSHLRFPSLNTRFYTDTMFSTSKSLRGNKCAQVFTNGAGYDLFYPMRKKFEAGEALNDMIRTIGVPKDLVSDGSGEETGGCFGKTVKEYKIHHRLSEPYSPWQNRAESSIRELKSGIRRATFRARSPKRLWDYQYGMRSVSSRTAPQSKPWSEQQKRCMVSSLQSVA